jgi:uncharacterized membrane protein (UPF0127 family)
VTLSNETRGTVVAAHVAAAASLWGRFMGLMGRTSLPADEGLWLPGVGSIHMMFMRFPIDCVFVGAESDDGTREVLAARRSLPPWRGIVWTVRGAKGVVELAAGALDRSGTVVGDRVRLADA